jgi:hypothetical protein
MMDYTHTSTPINSGEGKLSLFNMQNKGFRNLPECSRGE